MKLMNFPEAIDQLNSGKKITRVEWNNNQDYGVFRMSPDGLVLMLHKAASRKYHLWTLSDGDTKAEDWITVRDN